MDVEERLYDLFTTLQLAEGAPHIPWPAAALQAALAASAGDGLPPACAARSGAQPGPRAECGPDAGSAAIVVGHSLLFREMFRRFVSDECRQARSTAWWFSMALSKALILYHILVTLFKSRFHLVN